MKRLSLFWLWLLLLSAGAVFAQSETVVPAKDKSADFGGVTLHYRDSGTGSRALIFIHGWACDLTFWDKSLGAFPGNRVIAIDLPGHGRSDKPKTAYTMDYFARAVEAVMNDAQVRQAVLVGHSMGTPVARQFYRSFPAKTLGVVVVDGSLRPFGSKEQAEELYAPLRADYQKGAAAFIDAMLRPVRDKKLKAFIREKMLDTPGHVGLSAMESFTEEKIWQSDQIKVPVLAILAESPWWAPDTKEFYQTIAPDLEFHMWSGVSHFLMMERPADFNRAVAGFIAAKKLL